LGKTVVDIRHYINFEVSLFRKSSQLFMVGHGAAFLGGGVTEAQRHFLSFIEIIVS